MVVNLAIGVVAEGFVGLVDDEAFYRCCRTDSTTQVIDHHLRGQEKPSPLLPRSTSVSRLHGS